MGKKLGVGKYGLITSKYGNINLPSIFSNMAELPPQIFNQLSLETVLSDYKSEIIGNIQNAERKLTIEGGKNISISNLQGVVNIKKDDENVINI